MPDTKQQLQSVDQFADKIKAKYPVYQEMDNKELVDKIIAKHPVYKDQIDFGPTAEEQAVLDQEAEDEKQRQLSLNVVNDVLLTQAGIPEPLHGIASAVNQSVFSLIAGPIKFAKSIAFGLDDEVQEQIKENPDAMPEVWENYWDSVDQADDLAELAGSGTSGAEYMEKYGTASVSQLAQDGHLLAAANLTAEQSAAGAVSLIPAFFGPWGAAFLGVGAAGSAFDEDIQDEEKLAAAQEDGGTGYGTLMGAAIAKGGVEFASELVTAGIVGRAKKMARAGGTEQAVKEYVNASLKGTYLRGFAEEFFAEGLADTGNKIVDELFYGTEHEAGQVARDFFDNGLIGGIIGGKVAGVGYASLPKRAKAAVIQQTKPDQHLEAEKGDLSSLKTLEIQRQEAAAKAEGGDIAAQVVLESTTNKQKEVLARVEKRNQEHAETIDDLSPTELQNYAKEKDTADKLKKEKAKLQKQEGADPKTIEVIDEQIVEAEERANRVYTAKAREDAGKQVVADLEAKNEEHRADLESTAAAVTAEGKPKPKTKKQKLQEKKKKEAIKQNEKLIKQAKKETQRPADHQGTALDQAKAIKDRKPRVAANLAIAQDPNANTTQRNKAFNAVLKDSAQEIGAVTKQVRNKLANIKGVKTDDASIQSYIQSEIATLVKNHDPSKGAALSSRILHPNFVKRVTQLARKESQSVKKAALDSGVRAELDAELADIQQQVVDGILDPEAAEILKDDIRREYGDTGVLTTGVDAGTDAEGEVIIPKEIQEKLSEGPLLDQDSELDLINQVMEGQTVDQLLSDIPGNSKKLYALLPNDLKTGSAFSGLFQDGNQPPEVWESYFDDRKRKAALKKQIQKRLDQAQIPLSTDNTDAGTVFDQSLEFLDNKAQQTAATRILPLLGKLKRAFPGVKVIVSKAAMMEKLIEGGYDPGRVDNIRGMYADGNVYINPVGINAETPIHEFGHIWAKTTKKLRPELYAKGAALIKTSSEYRELANRRDNDKNSVYYGYSDAQLIEEAMATAIGKHGAEIFEHKADQSQWDKLRKQILDWVGEKMGITAINELTLDQFVKLAAVEIVTGDLAIPNAYETLQDSAIDMAEFKEVPSGSTRDYSRNTPPVTEYDTHREYKRQVTEKQMYDAVNRYDQELSVPGAWFGVTTGNFAETQSEIDSLGGKYDKKVNDKILGKVKGLRKLLDQEGYVMKRDPINPGFHQVYKKPNFEFSEASDLQHLESLLAKSRGNKLRERILKKKIANIKKDQPAKEKSLKAFSSAKAGTSLTGRGSVRVRGKIEFQEAGLNKETLTREEWQNALRVPTPVRNKKKYRRKDKHKKGRFDFQEDSVADVKRKIRNQIARGTKRIGDYKKLKVTSTTNKTVVNTAKTIEMLGDKLTYDQLVDINNRLKNLIDADLSKQEALKDAVRSDVNRLITETSNIDANQNVSKEDIEAHNTFWAKARRVKISNILAPASNNDFYGLLNSLLPKGRKARTEAKSFVDGQLLNPLEDANIEYLRMQHDLRRNWNDNLKDSGITQKILSKKTGIPLRTGQTTTNLNVGQVVKLYNYIKDADPKLQQQLLNTGVDADKAQQIIEYVESDPQLSKFAKGIPAVYASVAKDVNDTVQRHGYEGFEVTGTYTPLTVDSDSQNSFNQEIEQAIVGGPGMDLYSVMSGRLKKRKGGGQIDLTSSLQQDFEGYLNGPPRTAAFLDFAKNATNFFGAKQLKAMEAAYGKNHADAIRNSLFRIVSGRNQPSNQPDSIKTVDRFINRAVAGVMFFNFRSAILQMISMANYMFDDPMAFYQGAGSKEQREAISRIRKSPWFAERGLGKTDVALAELFGQSGGTKLGKGIDIVLEKGYSLTKLGDKGAIIAGGSAYMAGKYKQFIAQGMKPEAAWDAAYKQFVKQSEEAQQSTRAERLGQQQTTKMGKLVLAFANTPMQYNRKMAKALQDIRGFGLNSPEGRHAAVKIAYYGAAQNLLFNMLQKLSFSLVGLSNEDDDENENLDLFNSLANTVLRGAGVYGALLAGAKDALLAVHQKGVKGRGAVEQAALAISPAISTKVRHLRTAIGDRDPRMQSDLQLSKGAYQTAAALEFANIPADRTLKIIEQFADLNARDLEDYQKLLRLGGWSRYNLGEQLDKAEGGGDQYY